MPAPSSPLLLEGCERTSSADGRRRASRRGRRRVTALDEPSPDETADAGSALLARVGVGDRARCQGRTPQALLQFAEEALEAASSAVEQRASSSTSRNSRAPGCVPAVDGRLGRDHVGARTRAGSPWPCSPIVTARHPGRRLLRGAWCGSSGLNGTLILPDALGARKPRRRGLVPLIDRRVIETRLRAAHRRIASSSSRSTPPCRASATPDGSSSYARPAGSGPTPRAA